MESCRTGYSDEYEVGLVVALFTRTVVMLEGKIHRPDARIVVRRIHEAVESARRMCRAAIELEFERTQELAEEIEHQSVARTHGAMNFRTGKRAEHDGTLSVRLRRRVDLAHRLLGPLLIPEKRDRDLAPIQPVELGQQSVPQGLRGRFRCCRKERRRCVSSPERRDLHSW